MAAARWFQRRHLQRLVVRAVIDAGPGLEQISDGRLLLIRRQRRRIVVDAQPGERVVQVDLVIADGNADQCTEQALARGVEQNIGRYVAPGSHDRATLNDHDRSCAYQRRPLLCRIKLACRPAGLLRRDAIPLATGIAIRRRGGRDRTAEKPDNGGDS